MPPFFRPIDLFHPLLPHSIFYFFFVLWEGRWTEKKKKRGDGEKRVKKKRDAYKFSILCLVPLPLHNN